MVEITYKPKSDVSDDLTGKIILGKGIADGYPNTVMKMYKPSRIDGSGHSSGKSNPNNHIYAIGHAANMKIK